MRKFTMFFMSSLICLCGCFTACSGNSDDNGEEPDNGEVTGPITLTVDKAKIEANGTDMATFTVTDANGKVLTTSEYMKNVYFEDVTTGDYLERRTNTFSAVENGTHKFKAYYLDWESDEVSVTAQNRKNYELFYRKVGVFKMTGTWCTYCPAMTSALKKVEELMPGRMVKMAFHSSSSSATDPFHLSCEGQSHSFPWSSCAPAPHIQISHHKPFSDMPLLTDKGDSHHLVHDCPKNPPAFPQAF